MVMGYSEIKTSALAITSRNGIVSGSFSMTLCRAMKMDSLTITLETWDSDAPHTMKLGQFAHSLSEEYGFAQVSGRVTFPFRFTLPPALPSLTVSALSQAVRVRVVKRSSLSKVFPYTFSRPVPLPVEAQIVPFHITYRHRNFTHCEVAVVQMVRVKRLVGDKRVAQQDRRITKIIKRCTVPLNATNTRYVSDTAVTDEPIRVKVALQNGTLVWNHHEYTVSHKLVCVLKGPQEQVFEMPFAHSVAEFVPFWSDEVETILGGKDDAVVEDYSDVATLVL